MADGSALFGTIGRCGTNFYEARATVSLATSPSRYGNWSRSPDAERPPIHRPRNRFMARMIDQIRASKLPSNMMQFAARGALQVPAAENIEIVVHLSRHNNVFGELARMTLAGWDDKACLAAASDPQTPREVLDYFISPDNLRPKLLPALLENPSVPESQLAKLAMSAMRDTLDIILKSRRAQSFPAVVNALKSNPYLKKEELGLLRPKAVQQPPGNSLAPLPEAWAAVSANPQVSSGETASAPLPVAETGQAPSTPDAEQALATYLKHHPH